MQNKIVALLGVVIVGGLIYVSSQSGNSTTATVEAKKGVVTQKINTASNSIDLSVNLLDGNKLSLADYRGKKPVVLDFWASWCHNCQKSMPQLNALYQKYGEQVEVVGINIQEDKQTISSFVNSKGITFPIAVDPNGYAAAQFGIRYTNTHILINTDGSLARIVPGDLKESDILSLLN